MTNDDIKEISVKYRKHQKRLSFVLMILIVSLGIILIGVGIFISIYSKEKFIIIAGVIMAVLGAFDIPLIIAFNKKTQNRIDKMTDIECVKRYCRVYGIDYNNYKNKSQD